jgi:hypothetical protein
VGLIPEAQPFSLTNSLLLAVSTTNAPCGEPFPRVSRNLLALFGISLYREQIRRTFNCGGVAAGISTGNQSPVRDS